ncbi:uncharacterized protein LOC114530597 isoform X2 [Dendronephthya gigantea]|nr:uncharacterized protein LOC114530597 isoform X2 [Dendronephthya gigantea]
MVYDYVRNEHGSGKEWDVSHQNCNVSPLYADATDTTTRFYFSLERDATKSAETQVSIEDDEGSYVIAIPENIYDKPEDSMEEGTPTDEEHALDAGQLYFTLEECSEEEENNETIRINVVPEANADYTDGIYDVAEEMCENGTRDEVVIENEEQDKMNDDRPYVISIPNGANEYEEGEEEFNVINEPDDMNGEPSEQMRIETTGDGDDGCVEIKVDKNNECSENSGVEMDFDNSESIYENVTACLQPESQAHAHVNNAKISEVVTATTGDKNMITTKTFSYENSQENMGYLDDEVLTHSETEGTLQNNGNGKPHFVPNKSLASECFSDENESEYKECHDDDDIYEDWEDNIVGRTEELGLNQVSGCGDFYQNVRDMRLSLVMQKSG